MIVGLEGALEARGADHLIIRVGGMSFRVYVPTPTIATHTAPGERVRIHTYLYVREDTMALYGFSSPQELGLFEELVGVAGVGRGNRPGPGLARGKPRRYIERHTG